ncbi:glutathione S-transferase family protein [Rhodobacteraceae bacterium D3-12]|nr:glutathione S-transferase family protein [Rhodobacteraceae bacterium D3-12]
MYEVIGKTPSRATRVIWMLEEIGAPYTHTKEKAHSDLVTSLNPSGKIPLLRDGDDVISDSTAIMSYLGDKHGKLTYAAGTVKRGQQDAMTQRILDEVDSILWMAMRHAATLPEEHRAPDVQPSLRWEFAKNIKVLAGQFEGPFLMGDEVTIPDLILTNCLNWGHGTGFPVEHENLLAYGKAMRERDAYKRVMAAV